MIGFFSLSDRTIHIKKNLGDKEFAFVISHEARHIYQIDEKKFSKDYKQRHETDLTTYNNQAEEIDANAFAYLICASLLHEAPTFEELDQATRDKIKNKALEIKKSLDR